MQHGRIYVKVLFISGFASVELSPYLRAGYGHVLPETVRFYDADVDEDGILILDLRTARAPRNVRNHWMRKNKDVEENPAAGPRP